MTFPIDREEVARAICAVTCSECHNDCLQGPALKQADAAIANIMGQLEEPSEEMHDAARDWSIKKYGKAIGYDASEGCWKAMIAEAALRKSETH